MIYIVLLIIVALIFAWFASRSKPDEIVEETREVPDDCCGAHEVCEADSLLNSSDNIEYYDDEELDRFKGKDADQYNDAEIEEFRDILYTLKEREVANWIKSIQLRNIKLPTIIREEALMIVEERRAS
ncbi:hypothetical protein [Saccharicrinis fermentans]|uniref:Phospholipase n=1 Tax=Saccharicrinis fermentans DSM 9555 = JCM 21142 TaxID=869213 RepID=W7Y6X3_9BACT|nr:hypothetical protein [Saccharicrinis fermentans]GAF03408.1 hypothetical protein JCM21142_42081 [Saccharicrinis fermentans DSM 9555 = JCM 21142]